MGDGGSSVIIRNNIQLLELAATGLFLLCYLMMLL